MTRAEFQAKYQFSDSCMELIQCARDIFKLNPEDGCNPYFSNPNPPKVIKIREGSFYDEEIQKGSSRLSASKKDKLPTENKGGVAWDVFYNKA